MIFFFVFIVRSFKKSCNFAVKIKVSMTITTDIDLVLREQTALTPLEQVFVLVDENTRVHALPLVLQTLPLPAEQILCIPAGEAYKTLHTVELIWQFLEQREATRKSILFCLGGGVLTDLGGFAAATFKRGIIWINIPTTLLGMVDAAAGGKTGFNYGGFKNEIGLIREAKETIINPDFLKTLPPHQFLSGFAEMLKHALISSPLELASIKAFDPNHPDQEQLQELISRSVDIKNYIVDCDPEETGMRQTLNFGHTIGHAIEEYSLRHDEEPLLHGYAVLYGIVAELYLSTTQLGFPERDLQTIVAIMKEYYGKPVCPCKDYDELVSLMQHDKKNPSPDRITFTLLRSVGNYQLGCTAGEEEIREALDFLFNC